MSSKQDCLNLIENINIAKDDIKLSIYNKGVTVPEDTYLSGISGYVSQIKTGQLQTKSVTYNTAGTKTVVPDSGYAGISSLTIELVRPLSASWAIWTVSNPQYVSYHTASVISNGTEYSGLQSPILKDNFPNVTKITFSSDDISNWTVDYIDGSNLTTVKDMFRDCNYLQSVPLFSLGSSTTLHGMFEGCTSITSIPSFDTSSITGFYWPFENCTSLTTLPTFECGNATNFSDVCRNCTSLTTVGGFRNLGKSLTYTGQHGDYGISFEESPLTRTSARNIFIGLYDMTGSSLHQLYRTIYLNPTTYNSLSSGDINIATNKNWIITSR